LNPGVPRGAILASSAVFAAISAYLIVDAKLTECAKAAKKAGGKVATQH
jgi:hypothetical protein